MSEQLAASRTMGKDELRGLLGLAPTTPTATSPFPDLPPPPPPSFFAGSGGPLGALPPPPQNWGLPPPPPPED